MKLSKELIAVPAIALPAGLGLAACGSQAAPHAAPAVTHTVAAPAATPKPTTPASVSVHQRHLAHVAQVATPTAPVAQAPAAVQTSAAPAPAGMYSWPGGGYCNIPYTGQSIVPGVCQPAGSKAPMNTPPADPAATGPACTTVAGLYPGGLPGHLDPTNGFCVMDGGSEG